MFTLLSLLATALAGPSLDSLAWEDLGARQSPLGTIQLRRAKVDGTTCLEGTVTTEASVPQLMAVGRDMVSAKRWSSAQLAVSEELYGTDARYVLYQYFDVPAWTLASDRYWLIAVQTDADAHGFGWTRVPAAGTPSEADALARSSRPVEPPLNEGHWRFQEVEGGTRLLYRACVDMGGVLPDAVQRWVATQQLPATLEDFVGEALRR
jgi:hypothetical protein